MRLRYAESVVIDPSKGLSHEIYFCRVQIGLNLKTKRYQISNVESSIDYTQPLKYFNKVQVDTKWRSLKYSMFFCQFRHGVINIAQTLTQDVSYICNNSTNLADFCKSVKLFHVSCFREVDEPKLEFGRFKEIFNILSTA